MLLIVRIRPFLAYSWKTKRHHIMKKTLVITMLLLAVMLGKAQTADSLSMVLQHLAQTNKEISCMNDNLRLHSQIAVGSFVMMGFSAFSFYRSSVAEAPGQTIHHSGPNGSWTETPTDWPSTWKTIGITTGIIGVLGFVGSYLPLWTNKISLDGRGLVISLDGKGVSNGTR